MDFKTKICQNCKIEFNIESEDKKFYKKIDVPEPTFCPQCRMQRRLASWNERKLYKRKCDLCSKSMVTIYSPDKPFKVYCNKCWWSDNWDPMEYGREYDSNKSFFEQFYQLQKDTPVVNLLNTNSENSDYCHDMTQTKDCYLVFLGGMSENCSYTTWSGENKDCMDMYKAVNDELCYFCVGCSKCYKLFFSWDCLECHNSAFLYNCRNCHDCFGCVNLRNKKYHIFNKAYSKTEYEKEMEKYDLGSHKTILDVEKRFKDFHIKFPRKFARIEKAVNVVGDDMANSKNCQYCFNGDKGTEDSKYVLITGWGLKDSYDVYDTGYFVTRAYESVCVVERCDRMFFDNAVWTSRDVFYSEGCHGSSDLFGCVSLRKKKYCILNKQYSKEEYFEIVGKIKKQMDQMPYLDKKGREYKYGEYFPIELSRFGYNESIVQRYFPLNKEQASKQGYNWYREEKSNYETTIKSKDLSDYIKDIDVSILKETIECQNSDCAGSGVFKIIPNELKFYQKYGLALPRLCPECRHQERIQQRSTIKLWERQCMKKGCNTKFQTTYSLDRKEVVYCEKCYNKEVE